MKLKKIGQGRVTIIVDLPKKLDSPQLRERVSKATTKCSKIILNAIQVKESALQ